MAQVVAPEVVSPVMVLRIGGTLDAAGGLSRRSGNTLYYRLGTQIVPPTKTALNTRFQTIVIVPLLAATNARYHPNNVNIRLLNDASDPEVSFAAAGAGAIATDSYTSADAAVVCLTTPARGRQGRAFKHFGGASEVDTTGDVLTGASLVLWQAVKVALAAQLVDALGNVWIPWVRCNRNASYTNPPITLRGYDATGSYISTVIGTMRKRKTPGIKA